jgi:hypothetical protein
MKLIVPEELKSYIQTTLNSPELNSSEDPRWAEIQDLNRRIEAAFGSLVGGWYSEPNEGEVIVYEESEEEARAWCEGNEELLGEEYARVNGKFYEVNSYHPDDGTSGFKVTRRGENYGIEQ